MARKTIWYKKIVLGTIQNRTLQAALGAALNQLPTTGQRLRQLGQHPSSGLELINAFRTKYGMLCGHFINFEVGHRQPFLKGQDSASSFDLDAIAPPAGQANERREFLEGVAYFAIRGNHVILCQSKAASSRELERYLNWILWQATSTLPSMTAVVLSDQPSKRIADKINRNPVKAVTVGTPLEFQPIAKSETTTSVNQVRVSPKGVGAGVIEALFSNTIFDDANFRQAIEDDNIEVTVTVRFKHKQSISSSGEDLLRSLAKAARHMDSEDVSIELHNTGTISGDELRIHKSIDVNVTESGLIREDDLNQQMSIWFKDLLDSKMIDP